MSNTSVKGGVGSQSQEQITFPVFMIHSSWSLEQLDAFLANRGDVGFLRIVYDNEGKETDRTIAILPELLYDALCKEGFDRRQYGRGFKISQFLLNDSNMPGEGRTKTLFVPVPKNMSESDGQVIAAVVGKLDHLSEWGIIPPNSWSVNVPLKSREKGGVRSGCFVSFKREVELERVAMTRVLLTDTYWPETEGNTERPVFRCFWARDRKERNDNSEFKERSGKGESKERSGKSESKGKGEAKTSDKSKVSSEEIQQEKKRQAIQKVVKKAKPVAKKAPTIPVNAQPTLQGQE